jgi:hypothetical protein
LRFATDTSEGPDAVFSDGWREALRGAVAGSFLPAERAKELGLGAALEEARGQLRLALDGLPTAPTGPGPPEPLRTSVTGLVTFAACPQRFHWSEVDRLPRRPSAALRHGLKVHRRIELHHRGAAPFEEAREGFFDVGPGERGEPGAFGAFLSSRYAELKPILVEAPFTLRIGGASIAGRIDAVYEAERQITVAQRVDDWSITADGKQVAAGEEDNLGEWVRTAIGGEALTLIVPDFQGYGPGDPDLESQLAAKSDGTLMLKHYAPHPAGGDGAITWWHTAARTFPMALHLGSAAKCPAMVAEGLREPPPVVRDRRWLTVLLLFLVYNLAMFFWLYVKTRFRIQMMPVFFMGAGAAIAYLEAWLAGIETPSKISRWRWVVAGGAAIVLLTVAFAGGWLP